MMKLYKERLLSDAQLKRLGEHQYSCQSVSILDKLLQPYWNWLTSKVPIWLAPNLITILGLIVNIVTALILIWFSPDAKQEAPRWACGLCGFGLFVYQSLDAIDGKQARRTGTANPLGELFDHGCDSISTVFVALSACIAVQLGYYPGWMFFQCFCAMTLFYCAHWQTYVSGTLRFGRIDVTEAQYTIMGILLLSTIFGPSVWSTKFFSGTVCLWYLIPLSTLICGLWSLYQSIIVIFTGGVGKNGSTVAVFGFTFHWAHVVCTVFYLGFFQLFYTFFERIKEGGCGKNGSTVAVNLKRKYTFLTEKTLCLCYNRKRIRKHFHCCRNLCLDRLQNIFCKHLLVLPFLTYFQLYDSTIKFFLLTIIFTNLSGEFCMKHDV
ncbi:cholinephosphotransferase 1 isoform X5 [Tribolium castaneum]|uniref:cholinephosphotransferase 1 isoform X5 n=1 Tax=Tribolium castaneum TaxID=7070 RepID=UPI0030FE8229